MFINEWPSTGILQWNLNSNEIYLLMSDLLQEIPYVIEHRLMGWKELKDGSLRVEQHFIAPKQSQRQILVGKNGSKIGWGILLWKKLLLCWNGTLCILPINIYIIRTIHHVLIYLMGQICQENWYWSQWRTEVHIQERCPSNSPS